MTDAPVLDRLREMLLASFNNSESAHGPQGDENAHNTLLLPKPGNFPPELTDFSPVSPFGLPPEKNFRKSSVPGVFWVEKHSHWRASWLENGKPKQKNFSSVFYGDAEAFRLAVETRQNCGEVGGRAVRKEAERQAEQEGITWQRRGKRWCARFTKDGKRFCKSFSVEIFGDEEALRLAVSWRAENFP